MVFLSLIRSLIAVAGMPEAGIPLKNLRNRLRKMFDAENNHIDIPFRPDFDRKSYNGRPGTAFKNN